MTVEQMLINCGLLPRKEKRVSAAPEFSSTRLENLSPNERTRRMKDMDDSMGHRAPFQSPRSAKKAFKFGPGQDLDQEIRKPEYQSLSHNQRRDLFVDRLNAVFGEIYRTATDNHGRSYNYSYNFWGSFRTTSKLIYHLFNGQK